LERLENREAPGNLFGSLNLGADSLSAGMATLISLTDNDGSASSLPARLSVDYGAGSQATSASAVTDGGFANQSAPIRNDNVLATHPATTSIAIPSLGAIPSQAGANGQGGSINFDGVTAPPDFSETNALHAFDGIFFVGGTANNGGAILNQAGNFGVTNYSPPNFLAFNSGARLADGGIPELPEYITFAVNVNSFTLSIGSGADVGQTVTLTGIGNQGIETHHVTLQSALAPVTFTKPVHNVQVTGNVSILVIDNLSWKG
jgi:hypothetical protein